jgi:hypothetical protein
VAPEAVWTRWRREKIPIIKPRRRISCLNEHHAVKTYWGSRGIAPRILNLGTIQWVPGALSLGVKGPGREADHSPPSSAEVKE